MKKIKLENGCPACELILNKREKYKQCNICKHVYVGDKCEYCDTDYSKSKRGK